MDRLKFAVMLLFNFAFATSLYYHGEALTVVPLIGAGLHLVLVYLQQVFGRFLGRFIYLVLLCRRA